MTSQVSEMAGMTRHKEIGTIGYVVGAGVFVVLIPLLPFLAVLFVVQKLTSGQRRPHSN